MSDILCTETLRNGYTVSFHDTSHRYYGDFHRVRIVVRCPVPLTAEIFAHNENADELLRRARAVLGDEAVYEQVLERMGVAGDALEETRRSLIENFIRHTFSYLEKPGFAARFVARELARREKVIRPVQMHR